MSWLRSRKKKPPNNRQIVIRRAVFLLAGSRSQANHTVNPGHPPTSSGRKSISILPADSYCAGKVRCAEPRHGCRGGIAPTGCWYGSRSLPPRETPNRLIGPPRGSRGRSRVPTPTRAGHWRCRRAEPRLHCGWSARFRAVGGHRRRLVDPKPVLFLGRESSPLAGRTGGEEDTVGGISVGQSGMAHVSAVSPIRGGAPACIVPPLAQQDGVRA